MLKTSKLLDKKKRIIISDKKYKYVEKVILKAQNKLIDLN